MVQEILSLARLLQVNDGALLRLAGDVAHNRNIRSIGDLTTDQRLELYLFLQAAARAEGRLLATAAA